MQTAILLFGAVLALQAAVLVRAELSPYCGKTAYALGLGEEMLLNGPANDGPTSCRYKIRGPPGLHLEVEIMNLNSDTEFNLYDASEDPFRWQQSSLLELTAAAKTSGNPVVYPTNVIAIEYAEGSPSAGFTIAVKPVVPEDGDCGYYITATKESQRIRSPGWPKAHSPEGLRCSWHIRAKKGHQVSLNIEFLDLEGGGDRDYVEVYEWENRLAHQSGKLINRYWHVSSNGNALRVYYHTETNNSRGFKASYQEIQIMQAPPPPRNGDLKCNSRGRASLTPTGATFLDNEASTECEPHHVCAQLTVNGTFNTGGEEFTYDAGICLLRTECEPGDPCTSVSPPPELGVTVTSCKASCCLGAMCNVFPDVSSALEGPEVPSPGPHLTKSGKTCNTGRVVKANRTGTVLMKEVGKTRCSLFESCATFSLKGFSRTFGYMEVDMDGAACVPWVSCEFDACDYMPTHPDVIVTHCSATCCNQNFCNTLPASAAVGYSLE